MWGLSILQAVGPSVNSFVVFLAVLLLVFPILFVRSLLKGWVPGTTGGLFWKALLIFSSPFYIGVVVIKVFSATGIVSEEFGQLFPSIQAEAKGLPPLPEGTINFWSEFTVGLMGAALLSGIAAVLIYLIFKDREKAGKKVRGLVFWGALYASAIIVANGVFDRVQQSAFDSQLKKEMRAERGSGKDAEEKNISEKLFALGKDQALRRDATLEELDAEFRRKKAARDQELGEIAKTAPDGVIFRILQATRQEIGDLAGADQLACQYFFNAGTYLRRFRDLYQNRPVSPEMQALLDRLEDEARASQGGKVSPGMAAGEFRSKTEGLYNGVRQTLPSGQQNFDVFDNPQQMITPRQKSNGCLTYLAYLDQIATLPSEDAVRYYRTLLADRADALGAETLLEPVPELQALYLELAPKGSALDILFQDNPNLKRDFVFKLIEDYEHGIEEVRRLAADRKQVLLNNNIRYYFYLASNEAVYGHISFHSTLLPSLPATGSQSCGRFSGILERAHKDLFFTRANARHELSLGNLMKSTRTGGGENRNLLTGDQLEEVEKTLLADMRRTLINRAPDIDLLLRADSLQGQTDLARACSQAQAFYAGLARITQVQAAGYLRTLVYNKSRD